MGTRFDRRPPDYFDGAERECFSLELSLAALPPSCAGVDRGRSAQSISAFGVGGVVGCGSGSCVVLGDLFLSSDEGRSSSIPLRRWPNECRTARPGEALPERLSAAGNRLPSRKSS